MVVHPKVGQIVQVWYRAGVRDLMPHHGEIGQVWVVAKGPGPRNHGVTLTCGLVSVPCGNLRPVKEVVIPPPTGWVSFSRPI